MLVLYKNYDGKLFLVEIGESSSILKLKNDLEKENPEIKLHIDNESPIVQFN